MTPFRFPALFFAGAIAILATAVSPVADAAEGRPFLKACGRFTSRWAGRDRAYDIACWDLMQAAGVTITGSQLPWCDGEPTQGNYDWDAIDYTDFAVEEIRKRGMEVYFFLGLTPEWARLHPELDPHRSPAAEEYADEFAEFHRWVANRYKGKVRYYFFWNEPNGCSWINDGCSNGDGYPLYTRWMIRCSEAVKAADPDAKIIAGRLDYHSGVTHGYEYVEGIYAEGGGPHFDGIAIHPYDWTGSIHWQALRDVRNVLVAHGDADKPIWLTEYGWNSGDENAKAASLTAVLTELSRPEWSYVQLANYLVLNDGGGVENYGLTDADLNPRPAYYALRDFVPPAPDASPTVRNPSFEENGGSLTGWRVVHVSGEGPDQPPLDNTNPYGPRTSFGTRFGGKVTSWLEMNFYLGQVIEVVDAAPDRRKTDWDLSAHVNLHCRHSEGRQQPEYVHQVWEIGWKDDGSLPETIEDCDQVSQVASLDGTFTGNDASAFMPLTASGSIAGVPDLRYVVFRVRMYNDSAREWTISDIDNVSFTATARPSDDGVLSAY